MVWNGKTKCTCWKDLLKKKKLWRQSTKTPWLNIRNIPVVLIFRIKVKAKRLIFRLIPSYIFPRIYCVRKTEVHCFTVKFPFSESFNTKHWLWTKTVGHGLAQLLVRNDHNKGGLRNDNVYGRGNIITKSFFVYWKQLKSSNSCCTNLNPLGIKRFDSRISIYYLKWTPHCGANTMQKESLNPWRFELDTTLIETVH